MNVTEEETKKMKIVNWGVLKGTLDKPENYNPWTPLYPKLNKKGFIVYEKSTQDQKER